MRKIARKKTKGARTSTQRINATCYDAGSRANPASRRACFALVVGFVLALLLVVMLGGCAANNRGGSSDNPSLESSVQSDGGDAVTESQGGAAMSGGMEGESSTTEPIAESSGDDPDVQAFSALASGLQGKWYCGASPSTVEVMDIGDGVLVQKSYTIQRSGSSYQWLYQQRGEQQEQRYEILAPTQDLLEKCTDDKSLWEHAVAVLSIEYTNPTGAVAYERLAVLDDGRLTSNWVANAKATGQQGGFWHRSWEDAANDPHLLQGNSYSTVFDEGYVDPPE